MIKAIFYLLLQSILGYRTYLTKQYLSPANYNYIYHDADLNVVPFHVATAPYILGYSGFPDSASKPKVQTAVQWKKDPQNEVPTSCHPLHSNVSLRSAPYH